MLFQSPPPSTNPSLDISYAGNEDFYTPKRHCLSSLQGFTNAIATNSNWTQNYKDCFETAYKKIDNSNADFIRCSKQHLLELLGWNKPEIGGYKHNIIKCLIVLFKNVMFLKRIPADIVGEQFGYQIRLVSVAYIFFIDG